MWSSKSHSCCCLKHLSLRCDLALQDWIFKKAENQKNVGNPNHHYRPALLEQFCSSIAKRQRKKRETSPTFRRTSRNLTFSTRHQGETGLQNQYSPFAMREILQFHRESCTTNPSGPIFWLQHYFSKKYRNTPPICIAIRLQFVSQYFWCPYALRKGKYCQYSSHLYRNTDPNLYCNTPPICIAALLGKSWWLWSPESDCKDQALTKG